MMKNKKGMEIAISTLVGMIIGAMMLFAGIALLVTILTKTEQTYTQVDEQMRQEILEAYQSNDPIYIHKNPVSPRRAEDAIFGIAIQNIYSTKREFKVDLAYDTNKFETDEYKVAYLLPGENQDEFELNARQKEVFFIIVPTKNLTTGQHTLILSIEYENETDSEHFIQFDTKKVLYINK